MRDSASLFKESRRKKSDLVFENSKIISNKLFDSPKTITNFIKKNTNT